MNQRERLALDDVELWTEGTFQQIERVAEHLRSGAFFRWDKAALRFDADTHLLVVAAEHLRKALDHAPKRLGLGVLPAELAQGIEVLRDVYEHRDQHLNALC